MAPISYRALIGVCVSVQVSREDEHLGKVAKWALDNVKRPLVIVRTFKPTEVPLNA
jgi:hypothetical protein